MAQFEQFLAEHEIPNAHVHSENLPEGRKAAWGGAYPQWSEFWADEYIVRRDRYCSTAHDRRPRPGSCSSTVRATSLAVR